MTFTLHIKPFSLNQMYTLRNYKTTAYKEWEALFLHEMSKQSAQHTMQQIRESFKLSTDALCVRLTFYFPKDVLYTQDGKLSGRAYDLSNVEKPIIDLLCLPKIDEIFGVKNMSVDDKHIISIVSKKRQSIDNSFSIKVSVRIIQNGHRP